MLNSLWKCYWTSVRRYLALWGDWASASLTPVNKLLVQVTVPHTSGWTKVPVFGALHPGHQLFRNSNWCKGYNSLQQVNGSRCMWTCRNFSMFHLQVFFCWKRRSIIIRDLLQGTFLTPLCKKPDSLMSRTFLWTTNILLLFPLPYRFCFKRAWKVQTTDISRLTSTVCWPAFHANIDHKYMAASTDEYETHETK